MKFFSKQANLRVVLKHGMPAEPLTGRSAIPGLYVRFEDGVANVNDEEMIVLLTKHPRFNYDFINDEVKTTDPYAATRNEMEPRHSITEIKYGAPSEVVSSPKKVQISPELQTIINQEAMKMAKEMLTEILMAKANQENSGSVPATPVVETTDDIKSDVSADEIPVKTTTKKAKTKKVN